MISDTAAADPQLPLLMRDVTVAYHRKPVLWNVSLEIPSGRLVGLVGPNGAEIGRASCRERV